LKKAFKHSSLTQKEIESNGCNIALTAIEVCSIPKGLRKGAVLGLTPVELDILQNVYYLRKELIVFAYFLLVKLST